MLNYLARDAVLRSDKIINGGYDNFTNADWILAVVGRPRYFGRLRSGDIRCDNIKVRRGNGEEKKIHSPVQKCLNSWSLIQMKKHGFHGQAFASKIVTLKALPTITLPESMGSHQVKSIENIVMRPNNEIEKIQS